VRSFSAGAVKPTGTLARANVLALVGAGALALAGAGLFALAACGGDAPSGPTPSGSASPVPTAPTEARAQLAARAAAAQDKHMVATYRWSKHDHPDRTVSVTLATDGTWRVDVAGGALGGTADVSVTRTKDGLYQCALGSVDQAAGTGCVRVAGPDDRLGSEYDPRVEHAFTDWLAVLTDQRAALAVSPARAGDGVRGACYAVESSSASLAAPLDLGVYCYDVDGTLTAATLGFGTLALDGDPGPAPATVTLPGPVVSGDPLPTASPSPTTSATTAPAQ
jgi:hypothetical protein